jgi:hypothetical protein
VPVNTPKAMMKEETARTVANIVLAAAAVGAAVVVLRVPALRKMALGMAATALTTQLPTWLRQEVSHAWQASGTRTPPRA